DGNAPQLIIRTSDALVADVEGMDIYRSAENALLVVSSQGSNSYVVFDLNDGYRLVSHFVIRANPQQGVDGVSETDGLAVSVGPFPGYPQGILVVQDGRNRMPDAPQNFKIIDWRDVQNLVESSRP
ncbi:MAG: phytase, partial [Congregibacter sp.]|nr:phytase [Congregibacter sp.]